MKKTIFFFISNAFFGIMLCAQPASKLYNLQWLAAIAPTKQNAVAAAPLPKNLRPHFSNAAYNDAAYGLLPIVAINIDAPTHYINMQNAVYEPVPATDLPAIVAHAQYIQPTPAITQGVGYARRQAALSIQILPFRKNNENIYERLVSFEIIPNGKPTPANIPINNRPEVVQNSILAQNTWYKIPVVETGMYKIDKNYLNKIGVNINNINPRNIRIAGGGGGMLPEKNGTQPADGLQENAIEVVGEQDNTFNDQDYIVFYAQGANRWNFDGSLRKFTHQYNLYSDTNYYYINVDGNVAGKRIATNNELRPPARTLTTYTARTYIEEDKINVLNSGKTWLGSDVFDINLVNDYRFSLPNRIAAQPIWLQINAMASCSAPSFIGINANGAQLPNLNIDAAQVGNTDGEEYTEGTLRHNFINATNDVNLVLTYNKPTVAARAWLDNIMINATCALKTVDGQLNFRADKIDTNQVILYQIADANASTQIWNVTNPTNATKMTGELSGNTLSFKNYTNDKLQEFWAFGVPNLMPLPATPIDNQNLVGSPPLDLIIVAHPTLVPQANQLAAHRQAQGLRVAVIEPQKIYNEFSSGRQDITALRDFVRMLYLRAATPADLPRYLLLFGDASVDYKDRINNNTNLVPCYQSANSTHHIDSYTSDSFFGLLDENEGDFSRANEKMDIAVGRIPAATPAQAQDIIDKTIAYDSPAALGDWRNISTLVADDEDSNLHQNQCNGLSVVINNKAPNLLVDKIYFDAFKQISQNGGQRYPDAKTAVLNRINRGSLVMNYIGHGGRSGWAQEYVFIDNDLNLLNNKNKYPFMITGTCALAPFENPTLLSFGEKLILQPNSGTAAMFTTTRKTFPGGNISITTALCNDYLFTKNTQTNQPYSLGEACQLAMNTLLNTVNTRSFVFFGDPSMKLSIPSKKATITHINNQPINPIQATDTLSALAKVRFRGAILNADGTVATDFNGTVYPSVYDKISILNTLANDPQSQATNFTKYESILYKGKVSAVNGLFEFEFIVPKDISYNFGVGRISLYADNGTIDATGSFDKFYVGGTSSQAKIDTLPPVVQLYMNDQKFVNGSITNTNPALYAIVADSCGINTTGNGIGHDITAVLDGNLAKTIVLNDYYQAKLNSYTQGEVRYPFNKLSKGSHNIKFKIWDINNNSSERSIDFIVSENDGIIINNLLNYPNPFTTRTTFHFDHNLAGQTIQAQIQILSLEGTLVRTLTQTIATQGYHDSSFEWDGLDDYGDKIGKGVYVYKLKIKDETNATAQRIQKLVIF